MLVRFWGVHGSLPRPGPTTLKYGGNTPCVEVRFGSTILILDAGTGLRELGEDLIRRRKEQPGGGPGIRVHILISHFHWDHIQGLPFFVPAFVAGTEIDLYGLKEIEQNVETTLRRQMAEPNFPLRVEDLAAVFRFHTLERGVPVDIGAFEVRAARLNHPGGSVGFRVSEGRHALVYATDTENVSELAPELIDLCRGADMLIFDSMFDPDQYLGLWDDLSRESWGHSTWEAGIRLVEEAGVHQLVLFHHGNDDAVVEEMERKARDRFPNTLAAYEGLELTL